jgi:uracil-DNA glycosylase
MCEPHIFELLSLPFTHIVCLGNVAQERYTKIASRLPSSSRLPVLHLKHPAWFLRQDYMLRPLIEDAQTLRKFLQ